MIIIEEFITAEPNRSITGNKIIKRNDILIVKFSLNIFKILSLIYLKIT